GTLCPHALDLLADLVQALPECCFLLPEGGTKIVELQNLRGQQRRGFGRGGGADDKFLVKGDRLEIIARGGEAVLACDDFEVLTLDHSELRKDLVTLEAQQHVARLD